MFYIHFLSVESLPTSSQTRVMNAEEDDIFSDDFAIPDDRNDHDYYPSESSEVETDASSCDDSQKTKVKFCTA